MSREIKFRAWNTDSKRMKSWDDIILYKELLTDIIVAQRHQYLYANGEPKNSILMQYTGLKDKNIVDVYESDVLYNDDRKEHCLVYYSEERATFMVKYAETGDMFPLWESVGNLYWVVGNSYEHPHLLNPSPEPLNKEP